MEVEEYEAISGDVDLPTNYSGTVKKTDGVVSTKGIYYADDKTKPIGQFTFNLQ